MTDSQENAWAHMPPTPVRVALAAYQEHLHGDATTEAAPGRLVAAWAPGRANLIGEHTDYNEGYVLPVAIDRVAALVGHTTAEPGARLYSVHHRQEASFALDAAALAAEPAPERLPLWAKYVRGVLAELEQRDALPSAASASSAPGFVAAIAGDVPVGGGLSSSAALEVATATFAQALGGAALPAMTMAQLCQRAEQRSVGVRVGIMDQATSCLGRAGNAILLDCRSLDFTYVPVELPEVALAVYDTRVSHSLASSGYNERRAQCEEAVALLAQAITTEQPERRITALRDITPDDLARYSATLPDVLLRRARHVVYENARVLAAVDALKLGDGAALGELLYASHASLRDDYQVSCAELDAVVEIARSVPGVLGARMMGGGFGGSALALVRRGALPALAAALASEYPRRAGRTGELHVCQIADGPQSMLGIRE